MTPESQIVYEFRRVAQWQGWWLWAALVLGLAVILLVCLRFYRRDVVELPRPVRWTLTGLRLVSVLALIFLFFDLQRRTERLVTRPSEVVVLADGSQSMSLPAGSAAERISRTDRVAKLLNDSDLLGSLQVNHRVSVYRFDDEAQPDLLQTTGIASDPSRPDAPDPAVARDGSSSLAQFGVLAITIGLIMGMLSLLIGAAGKGGSVGWLLLTSASCLVIGGVCLGSTYAVSTNQSLASLVGMSDSGAANDPGVSADEGPVDVPDDSGTSDDLPGKSTRPVTDWRELIAADGNESRIGDALRTVLADHEPSTLAGVILITDGQNNGGAELTTALSVARRNEVSLYPVGMGSSDPPINVRVVDLDAPKRIYPGDKFAISAVLQASGPRPIEAEVQLLDGLDNDDHSDGGTDVGSDLPSNVVDSKTVRLETDGTLSGIRFELEPETVGRRRIAIRIVAPHADTNQRDDSRVARYEVVSRKLRVLTVAGGPTREYRFVRNLFHRDDSVELDVWLQSGQPGISQDASEVLEEFPSTTEALFQYDAILMFDPDWAEFSMEDLDRLDRWLAEQAGGMILVAGPIYHSEWFRRRTDPRVSKTRAFFPVDLATRGPLLGGGRQGGQDAWPLDLTPEARRSQFLWIEQEPAESVEAWQRFGGVYDFVGVRDLKPGAKAYAYFSDPTARIGDSQPVYLASQFFGAGRTFFQASGEMWRLREQSDAYFDRYYTQLVRWVSEGRLLRDSNRGILLVDNSRAMVGDTIVVRAVLTDDQFEPLQVPEVTVNVLTPSGAIDELNLSPLQGEPRPGTYGGRLVVREPGSYQLRLTMGDALAEDVLRQNIQVRLPTLELERPQRNDQALGQLAQLTAGEYLPVDAEVSEDALAKRLAGLIRPQPQTTVLPGTPDREFTKRRNITLMWLVATLLTFEWVTRRLHRLA